MNISLGNITFNEVREKLGYQLTEEDKIIWDKYHNEKADLSDMENCFHVFDMPRAIHFKGEEAKNVIIKMFTPDKLVESKGKFAVCEKTS